MSYRFLIVILMGFLLKSFCCAEMYIWADENGVKHFTDTPPNPVEVSPGKVKQAETSKHVFGHRLYKKFGEREYCGDYQLPVRKNKDSKQLLEEARRLYNNSKENRRNWRAKITSNHGESYKRYQERVSDEYECAMEWATEIIAELEHVTP